MIKIISNHKSIFLGAGLTTVLLVGSLIAIQSVNAANPSGYFDVVDNTQCYVKGWLYDSDSPSSSVDFELWRDRSPFDPSPGTKIGRFTADGIRTDVNNPPSNIPGNHGFGPMTYSGSQGWLDLSDSLYGLRDGVAHQVFAIGINFSGAGGSVNLGNSPRTITCSALVVQPIISDMNPRKGPTSGGTRVIITGGNFSASGAAVAFDGVQGTIISRSANSIVVDTPQHSGTGTVAMRITNPDGVFADSPNFQFTYGNPIITGLNPASGPLSGGTEVTISGDFFTTNPTVTFGGTQGQIVSASLNSIRVRTPSQNSAGTVAIRVTNPNNAFADSPNFQFTYEASVPPPPPPPSGGGNLATPPGTDGPLGIIQGENFILNWATADADTGLSCAVWWYKQASDGTWQIQSGGWSGGGGLRESANGTYRSYTVSSLGVGEYRFHIRCSGLVAGSESSEDFVHLTVGTPPPSPSVPPGGGGGEGEGEEQTHHTECQANACALVEGAGVNECVISAQCEVPPPAVQHAECINNQCILRPGEGANMCSVNAECLGAEPPQPPQPPGGSDPNDPEIKKFEPNLTVPNPPECEFSATRDKILPNEPASLEWECNENVVRATLMGGEFGSTGIGVISGGAPKIGEKEVSPLGTTTYTLKSWNAEIGGFYDEDIATIEVKPFTPFIKEIIPR